MLGLNAVTYRNTSTYGAPTFVAIPELESVNVTPSYTEAESNSRASQFGVTAMTLAGVTITARLKVKPGNTNYEALMDAFALRQTVDLLILDGSNTTVGARGLRAECYLMQATDDQAITNRLYRDLEIRLADTDNPPKWAKVGAGPTIQYAEPGGSWA